MKKDTVFIFILVLIAALFYALTLRGVSGNPSPDEFKGNLDQAAKPFELSPERGRYVHVYSLAERGRYDITEDWAKAVFPDVGISVEGRYYSFFAPGVAYFTAPFYTIGSEFNMGQVAAFSAESLVSIITLVFIFLIGRRVFNLPQWAAFFASLTFGFASTSWSYAITLYQNAFTACFMVTAFYAAWRFGETKGFRSFLHAAYVWLAYAMAIFADYPNAILFLPIIIYMAVSSMSFQKITAGISVSIRRTALLASLAFVLFTGFHLLHNTEHYGSWKATAGGLTDYRPEVLGQEEILAAEGKDVSGFFHESDMFRGLYVLLLSDERGLFFYSPIFLFSLLGIGIALKKQERIFAAPLALVAFNIFLYSAWGDPWGGWAYGPRYLIPILPWLSLFSALALLEGRHLLAKKFTAFLFFLYSSGIALLGALTTNAIPPKHEAIFLPAQQYNYFKNIDFLWNNTSSSFAYNIYFAHSLALTEYFLAIFLTIAFIALFALFASKSPS